VSRVTCATQIATPATGINLAHNALPDELAVMALFHNTDKLVPDRSIEPGVTARNFQVGVADARQQHAHQRLIRIVRLLDLTKF
jgi:hypothetical protein